MKLPRTAVRKTLSATLVGACLAVGAGYPNWSHALYQLGYYTEAKEASALAAAWQQLALRLDAIHTYCASLGFVNCVATTAAVQHQAGAMAEGYDALANDPADPDYATIEAPQIERGGAARSLGVPWSIAGAWSELLVNYARTAAMLDAQVTSSERAQGAALAGADGWRQVQAQLAALYASELGRLTAAQPALAQSAIAAWYSGALPAIQDGGTPPYPDALASPDVAQKTVEFSERMSRLADAAIVRVEIGVRVDADVAAIDSAPHGLVKVVIMGSDILDARQIDPASLRFGPGLAGITDDGRKDHERGARGQTDLVVHFALADADIGCGDGVATLLGSTLDGRAIGGLAYILTPGCRR